MSAFSIQLNEESDKKYLNKTCIKRIGILLGQLKDEVSN